MMNFIKRSVSAVVMAEPEQNMAGNEPELQHFSGEALEEDNSNVNEVEQQHFIVTDGSEQENSVVFKSEKEKILGDDSENLIVNGNELENKISADESEQNNPEGGAEPKDALKEPELDMPEKDSDLAVKEQNEVALASENVHHEEKRETDSVVNSEGEKKWPGWPG